MNTPFGNSITTAEHAIALMFALARQLPEANTQTQAGLWPKNGFMGIESTWIRKDPEFGALKAVNGRTHGNLRVTECLAIGGHAEDRNDVWLPLANERPKRFTTVAKLLFR
jgi:hypothetical protein